MALQISELVECPNYRAVEEQMKSLPKDLDAMYERNLSSSSRPLDLKKFLIWLAFSNRPLKAEELADVATVHFPSNGLPFYDPDLRYFGPKDMLAVCSMFIAEFDGEFRLIH